MPLKLSVLILLASLLAGCADTSPAPPKISDNYVRVSEPYALQNTAVVNANINKTWAAALQYFKNPAFVVHEADRKKLSMLIEFHLGEPSKYMDCGTWITTIDGVEQQPIKYLAQKTLAGGPGSDKVFGAVTIKFSELGSNKSDIEVFAIIRLQTIIESYYQNSTYENEIRFSSEMKKIGDEWVTITTPYTVEVQKFGPEEYRYRIDTRTARTAYVYDPANEDKIDRYGFDCHSTQQLEQMILQGIAAELEAGGK